MSVTIEVSSNDLKETLNIAQATLSNESDITSHFLFSCEKQNVYVLSTDLPRTFSKIPLKGVKVTYPDDVEEESAVFTVNGKRLLKASSVSQGVITISHEDGDVKFSSEHGVLTFGSLDPSAYPPWESRLSKVDRESSWEVPADVLADILTGLKPYVSEDEARRPELCLIAFIDGIAYSCDGFGLGMARHDEIKGINGVKVHFKDIGSLSKYLRAHSGNQVKVMSSSQATFMEMDDGAVYGFMDLPHKYPDITKRYADAFDYNPARVWALDKGRCLSALSFLSAGADSTDTDCVFLDDLNQPLNPPRLEMNSESGKGVLGYDLQETTITPILPDGVSLKDGDSSLMSSLGEKMVVDDMIIREKGEEKEDISTFKFNSASFKRILDTFEDTIYFGVDREGGNRGYLVFKLDCPSGVQVASVVGWVV